MGNEALKENSIRVLFYLCGLIMEKLVYDIIPTNLEISVLCKVSCCGKQQQPSGHRTCLIDTCKHLDSLFFFLFSSLPLMVLSAIRPECRQRYG
jgi:hypothetical protein